MHAILKTALAVSTALAAAHASAQVTFYQHDDFGGASFTSDRPIDNFQRLGFNDRASSVVVKGNAWEVCDDAGFRGRCMVLRPGSYRSLRDMGMNDRLSSARAVPRNTQYGPDRYAPRPMPGQITLFERSDFEGRSFNATGSVSNFRRYYGVNDRASSAIVLGDRWEACEDVNYSGRCVVLRPGRYPSLAAMGLNNRLSSVRELQPNVRVDDGRYGPPPVQPVYDWRRRPDDRLHQAAVTDVRAVYGAPQQQHCWVEREKVVQNGGPNVGGALIGGVIGGILGHQIGGGSGRDIATVGGAVAGAAIGANVGPDGRTTSIQNVQRCSGVPAGQGRPDYWDVTYSFRGNEHHVQTTSPPGRTITVNDRGEPRL